jgi:NADP-dependent 3-hydroxy acid dehydrogenase YdfG
MATSNKTDLSLRGSSRVTLSGIGQALAVGALDRGDRVVATARRPGALTDLTSRYPGQALSVKLDVRNEKEAQRAVSEAVAAFVR